MPAGGECWGNCCARCAGHDHGCPAGLAAVGGAASARAGRHRPLRAPARRRRSAGQGGRCRWLLDRAATYLRVHARLAEARPLAERALAITEAAYGPDHPDVAIRAEQPRPHPGGTWGSRSEARPLAERALAITEAAYGPGHPQAATLRG